jgi:ABC-2 type transport system permease protein
MTTMTSPSPAPPVAVSRVRHGELVGLWVLLRLNLRRERISLLIWIIGVSAVAASTFSAITSLYPGQAERAALAGSITANPAFLAMLGPIGSTTVGGLTAWRIGVLAATMIGLMAIFTVIGRTRADEETGRTELLMAGVVGRSAQLVAAVIIAAGAALLIGLLVAVAGIAQGAPVTGSVALGAAFAGCGWVFAGVAAVTAQLTENARTATAMAGAVLGAGYAIRAIGDTVVGWKWMQWLSPQGWVTRVNAFGTDQILVLVLFAVTSLALVGTAVVLLHRRDVGLALFPARLGPPSNPRLTSPDALAVRLHRGSLTGWAVGFVAFGAITGGIAASAGDLINGSPQLAQIINRLGGAGVLIDAFLAALGAYAGLLAAAYAISAVLRMHTEEAAERVSPILATAVGRTRWLSGHLMFALGGAVLLLALDGVVTGIVHGARIGDLPTGLDRGLVAMLIQVPPVMIMGGFAMVIYGWWPRLSVLAWAALGLALVFGLLGRVLQLPQILLDLSPYTHMPSLPGGEIRWLPVLVELGIAAALVAVGVAGLRRRDVM